MHKTKNWGLSQAAGAVNKWKNRIYEKSKNSFLTFRTGLDVFWSEWKALRLSELGVKAQQQQSKYDEYKKKGCPTILGLLPLAESIKLVHKFLKCVLHS